MSGKHGETKKSRGTVKVLLTFILLGFIAIAVYYVYLTFFSQKFQDVFVEIGTSLPTKEAFLIHKQYAKNTELLTDLSNIDMNEVEDYLVELSYRGIKQEVVLHVEDTTRPNVTFQNVFKTVGYEVKAEDFVKEMSDLSPLTVKLEEVPDTSIPGEYPVTVIVKDDSDNVTKGECRLVIRKK